MSGSVDAVRGDGLTGLAGFVSTLNDRMREAASPAWLLAEWCARTLYGDDGLRLRRMVFIRAVCCAVWQAGMNLLSANRRC